MPQQTLSENIAVADRSCMPGDAVFPASCVPSKTTFVVSRDSFILWARSSTPAPKRGAFFRTSAGPIEIPSASLPLNAGLLVDGRAGAWFREPVREMTVFAEQYDFAISLLLLDDSVPVFLSDEENEQDTFEKMVPAERRRDR